MVRDFLFKILKKLSLNKKILKISKVNTVRDYIDLEQLYEILFFILNKKITNQ